MIDGHLNEGRSAKVAIRTVDQEVTYAELAESVNRCGNALLGQGLTPGQRMLMIVKDCPEFIFLVYGAIKAGIVPVRWNSGVKSMCNPGSHYTSHGIRKSGIFHPPPALLDSATGREPK